MGFDECAWPLYGLDEVHWNEGWMRTWEGACPWGFGAETQEGEERKGGGGVLHQKTGVFNRTFAHLMTGSPRTVVVSTWATVLMTSLHAWKCGHAQLDSTALFDMDTFCQKKYGAVSWSTLLWTCSTLHLLMVIVYRHCAPGCCVAA